jgi:hypothetical protein
VQDVPRARQLLFPAHEAFVSVLQPLRPRHSFFALQQLFSVGGALLVDGVAGSLLGCEQAAAPARMPVAAVNARAFARSIMWF